jgi:uncharacterized repeat protein (TIGR01451 family)
MIFADYIPVYHAQVNGGIVFTGNTLGLDKSNNTNGPGTAGSAGAFISQDQTSKVGNFPSGTTLNYLNNGSSAELDLPIDSVILHAELIWSGSYGYGTSITLELAQTNPIKLICPDGTSYPVKPRKETAQHKVHNSTLPGGFYVCSADVTDILRGYGRGRYTAGAIAGTVAKMENANNCAGWTLAIAYSHPHMLTSSLHLYVGCSWSNDPALNVTGFMTPANGIFTSRLFVSALETDQSLSGDQFRLNGVPLSGTNNPVNNFFCSQINTKMNLSYDSNQKLIFVGSSFLDTRGSFGTLNHSLASPIAGARQGYDITSIPISLPHQTTSILVQPTTKGDGYTVNALGLQIQQASPLIQATTTQKPESGKSVDSVSVGDEIDYQSEFLNVGEGTALEVFFSCPVPSGMNLVENSILINGQPASNLSNLNNIALPDLEQGSSNRVEFKLRISSIKQEAFTLASTIDYKFDPYPKRGYAIEFNTRTNTVIAFSAQVLPPVVQFESFELQAGSTSSGNVLHNDTGQGLFVISATTPKNGTLSIQTNGEYTYLASRSFSGRDSFTYTVSDERGQTSVGVLDISILPLAVSDSITIPGNIGTYQATSILPKCLGSNLEGIPSTSSSWQGGTVVFLTDGTYTYSPPSGYCGNDSFSYSIQDGEGNVSSSVISFTILSIASNDTGMTVANTPLHGFSTFANNPHVGTLAGYTQPCHGTVEMFLDGTYTYIPFSDYSGVDTFSYTIEDQFGQNFTTTVTITVTPYVPSSEISTSYANTQFIGPSVLFNGAGSKLSIYTYDYNSVYGGVIEMDYTTGIYTFSPSPNFSGEDVFFFIAEDEAGQLTQKIPVRIHVLPKSADDLFYTFANTPLFGSSILSNDEGNLLEVYGPSLRSTNAQGQASLNVDGTFTYIPPSNFSGTDSFTYQAIDSSGQIGPLTTVQFVIKPKARNGEIVVLQNSTYYGSELLDLCIGENLSIVPYQVNTEKGGKVHFSSDGSYVYAAPKDKLGSDRFQYNVVTQPSELSTKRLSAPFQQQSTGIISVTIVPLTPSPSGETFLNFRGKIKKGKLLNGTTYRLEARWNPIESTNGGCYRIYSQGVLIAEIPFGSDLVFSKCFNSKTVASNLEISFVYGNGVETTRQKIVITPLT